MHRTLLFIPHEIAGVPVFGFGWALVALAIGFTIRMAMLSIYKNANLSQLANELWVWAIAMAVIVFAMPMVELKNIDGAPSGMAIRGYGVMLLLGVCAAVSLAAYRATLRGIDPDVILAMAPWAFIGGIIGARMFYVIQYRENFYADSVWQTFRNMLAFTEGGLVVYGSFIGGFIAGGWFALRHKIPFFKLGDIIVPSLFIGVFLGRIGCLMNGCCYGGRCDDAPYALYFPPNSPVYVEQLESGELLGLLVDSRSGIISSVQPNSIAAEAGVVAGSKLERVQRMYPQRNKIQTNVPEEQIIPGVAALIDGKTYQWTADELPTRALAVQPAQLISSLGSLALCLALCAIPLGRYREGLVLFLGLSGYAILRFIMELIRVDEGGQFGTSLSISQWVSIIVLVLCLVGLAWIYQRPKAPEAIAQ